MTANSDDFVNLIIEHLQSLRSLSRGRFFGGTALRSDGIQFAMLMGDVLFFVVDDTTRPKYEALGMKCFWYNTKKGKINVRKYFEVPTEVLENQTELLKWAKQSIAIAKTLKSS